MDYIFRLTRGMDLREQCEQFCREHRIASAVMVSCVGCLYQAKIRLADGKTVKQFDGAYEIVSLVGTFSKDGAHLHISIADKDGAVIGGHLSYGCYVNTTAEVAIRSLDERYVLSRQYDESTGYDELVIVEKED